ncbi:hypothetical protein [Mycobacterium uberis]|uniref:hypothetical protein n=1 Tax=Mycobacterium uberis TaxID=2162698 RepID=UPI001FB4FB09|nr:hypothetical protein [Mycobacterium uberis]
MRANLEVLFTLELAFGQHEEVISDILSAQSWTETTFTALEWLAQGGRNTFDDFVSFDVTELLDHAARDALCIYPRLQV